jgi:hypothetical protein
MALLQLIGMAAFIVASLALGAKLLLLWRRTREVPELALGVAFLLGGGLGYVAWLAMLIAASAGAGPLLLRALLLAGLACTCLGALAHAMGVASIFRPGARWTGPMITAFGLWVAGSWTLGLVGGPEQASQAFWAGVMGILPLYVWAAGETFVLAHTLHRRARLGLADPVVAHRIAQWGVSSSAVVVMSVLSFVGRLLYGPVLPPWVGALNAVLGLVAATAIWLGFFPPRALRARLAAAYGS